MKNKYKAPPHINMLILCVIFALIWNISPVQASVSDNLQSALAKIIGQKNETTTKANYSNASIAAKLNYLETAIASSSGGAPRCIEAGSLSTGTTRTFAGPGVLYINRYNGTCNLVVDGCTIAGDPYAVPRGATEHLEIPFHEQCVVKFTGDPSITWFNYSYHKY